MPVCCVVMHTCKWVQHIQITKVFSSLFGLFPLKGGLIEMYVLNGVSCVGEMRNPWINLFANVHWLWLDGT